MATPRHPKRTALNTFAVKKMGTPTHNPRSVMLPSMRSTA
jgi:hypothetical protein